MERIFHADGSAPAPGQKFVFGSNLQGLHLGGAAMAAHNQYGAEMGVGFGPTGDCFAIPTVSMVPRTTLSLDEIRKSVATFLLYASETPDNQYLVTRIGCGIAGHKDADIAPMFSDAPSNCSLPDTWAEWLAEDAAMFQEQGCFYSGKLLDDCAAAEPDSIMGMMGTIKTLSDSILGDGKNNGAESEARCAGHYSMQATGRG